MAADLPTHTPRGPPSLNNLHGMSPKKSHEVVRMSAYIHHLLRSSESLAGVTKIVDVGSGQVSTYWMSS